MRTNSLCYLCGEPRAPTASMCYACTKAKTKKRVTPYKFRGFLAWVEDHHADTAIHVLLSQEAVGVVHLASFRDVLTYLSPKATYRYTRAVVERLWSEYTHEMKNIGVDIPKNTCAECGKEIFPTSMYCRSCNMRRIRITGTEAMFIAPDAAKRAAEKRAHKRRDDILFADAYREELRRIGFNEEHALKLLRRRKEKDPVNYNRTVLRPADRVKLEEDE